MDIIKANLTNAYYDYGIMAPETKWIFSLIVAFLVTIVLLKGILLYFRIQFSEGKWSKRTVAKKYLGLKPVIQKIIEYSILLIGWIFLTLFIYKFFTYIFP